MTILDRPATMPREPAVEPVAEGSQMQFGLFYLGGSPREQHAREYEEILEQAEYADELGFDNIWLSEHHGSNYGTVPSPQILAAAIAQRTKRIRIGVAVSILTFQHPVRVAEDWAMIDNLSNGRLDFGAGRGYQPREFRMMGADPETSREVFAEALDIVLGLWEHGRFSYAGKHFTVDDAEIFPKPIQKPVPLWIAALSPPTYKLVAEKGANILMTPLLSPMEELKEKALEARQVLIDGGRDPESIIFPLSMVAYVAPTREQARAEMEPALGWHFKRILELYPGVRGQPIEKGYEAYADPMKQLEALGDPDSPWFDAFVDSGTLLVSDPAEACDFLRDLRDSIDLRHFTAATAIGGLEHDKVMACMKLWAEEVMPVLREESAAVAGAS